MKTNLLLSAVMAIAESLSPMKLGHSISNHSYRDMPRDILPSHGRVPIINRAFTRANSSNRKQRRSRK